MVSRFENRGLGRTDLVRDAATRAADDASAIRRHEDFFNPGLRCSRPIEQGLQRDRSRV